jgi:ubiquinone/menaquinone biosynthesis C-methylase UbiE
MARELCFVSSLGQAQQGFIQERLYMTLPFDHSPCPAGLTGADLRQLTIDQYFEAHAADWKIVYEHSDLRGRIYQERRDLALRWIDELRLSRDSRALETGCGAGIFSTQLALRGAEVDCIDTVPAMLELTRARAEKAGVRGKVRPAIGDVHRLAYATDTFDLVLAIGVLPWLHSPHTALSELVRTLKPGGYLLATADNLWRLQSLFDPRRTAFLHHLRRVIGSVMRKRNTDGSQAIGRFDSIREIDRKFSAAGLQKVKSATVGFGPFTVWDKALLGDVLAIRLHSRLQSLAFRSVPVLKSTGAHYVVLAKKRFRPGPPGKVGMHIQKSQTLR